MNNKKKSLTKNALFYILYNALNIFFPLITGIYAARILLPDSIGLVESARNLVQYFVILSFLGIPTYGLREISKYQNNKDELSKIYSELFIINFISTCFFGLIYLILIFSIPSCRSNIYLYLLVGLLILLNVFNNSWLYEGLEEFKYISIRNFIFKIVSFLFLIIFVKDSSDYLWYASITIIGTAGNYIFNIINSRKIVRMTIKNLNFKRHFKPILYLVFVNLAIEIYSLVDITMLSIFCKESNVAYYSYGIKIHKILLQIINTFTMVIVPRLSLMYKNKETSEFNALLSKTFKIILVISIPLIIGISFVSDYMICTLYGDSYITSSYVLKVLSLSLFISPVGYLLGSRVMLVTGNENKMIIPVSVGAFTNVILNLLLIPKFNEIGAAIASVFGEVIVMIIYLLFSVHKFKLVNMKKSIFTMLLSNLIMTIYLLYISCINLNSMVKCILEIVGAICIYFLILILKKEEIVMSIYNKIKNKLFGGKYGITK